MEPIGELDSVQHPLPHVCAGFRHLIDVFLYPWAVAFHTLDCWRSLKPLILLQFLSLPSSTHGAKEPWNGHES